MPILHTTFEFKDSYGNLYRLRQRGNSAVLDRRYVDVDGTAYWVEEQHEEGMFKRGVACLLGAYDKLLLQKENQS